MFNWVLNMLLKFKIKTSGQHHSCCSGTYCWLWIYFTHWFSCIFQIFQAYLKHSCFSFWLNASKCWVWRFQKSKISKWHSTLLKLLLKFLSRERFYIKKSFTNSATTMIYGKMKYYVQVWHEYFYFKICHLFLVIATVSKIKMTCFVK